MIFLDFLCMAAASLFSFCDVEFRLLDPSAPYCSVTLSMVPAASVTLYMVCDASSDFSKRVSRIECTLEWNFELAEITTPDATLQAHVFTVSHSVALYKSRTSLIPKDSYMERQANKIPSNIGQRRCLLEQETLFSCFLSFLPKQVLAAISSMQA